MEGMLQKENSQKNDAREEPMINKNPLRKVLDMCEQMFLFSILYIHSSPLQPLIGPGSVTSDNFFLVHACYFAILLFVPLAYFITNLPGIQTYLSNDANLCVFVENKETCANIVSDLFTNRFSLAVASLFMIMSLATMKCFQTNEYTRPSLHNGFWILKLMFIFVVSLIAFSIPPALFDSIWQYVCALGTLTQTLFVMFLLLDWTNAMKCDLHGGKKLQTHKECSKDKAKKILAYAAIFMGFLSSASGIVYIINYSYKQKGFQLFDIVLLVLPLKAIIVICLFARRVASSMLQTVVILCYILFRLGLSMAYEIPCLQACRVYIIIDTHFKLVIVAYSLFRHLRKDQYSVDGSIIYGYALKSNLALNDRKLSDTGLQSQDGEVINGSKENSTRTKSVHLDEQPRSPDEFEEKSTSFTSENADGSEKRLKISQKTRCPSSAHTYSYSLLHFFLLSACLDINADLTSFKVLAERNSKFELSDCRIFAFILNTSPMITVIAFMWSKAMKRFYANIDEYSISSVIQTFIQSAVSFIVRVMTEPPIQIPKIKYIYMGMVFKYLIISLLLLCPAVKTELERSSLFCSQNIKQGNCLTTDPRLIVMYQISLSFAIFFLILMILMLGATASNNPRNIIHFGFWPSKILFLGLAFTFSFYLPMGLGSIWTHMALAATLLVTLLQTIAVLDSTSHILDHIRVKEDNAKYPNKIYLSCSSIAVFLYTLTITAFFCFYVYFAQFSACKSNRIFISINLVLCILASLVSLHPVVQTGGLVQSAVMTSFCMYCTWTALYNNPREQCNPMALFIFESDTKPTKGLLFTVDIIAFIATIIYVSVYIRRIEDFLKRFLLICFKGPCVPSVRLCKPQNSSDNLTQMSFQDALLGKQRENYSLPPCENEVAWKDHLRPLSENTQKIDLDAGEDGWNSSSHMEYNCSFFHLIYALLVMHLFTLMITWTDERPGSHMYISIHWAIMCVKMVASSACVLLYIWSLVVHLFTNISCRHNNRCL